METLLPNNSFRLKVRAIGMPMALGNYLERNPHKHKDEKLYKKMKEFDTNSDLINMVRENEVFFGPGNQGPNLLIIKDINQDVYSFLSRDEVINSLICGFDRATEQGPLCEEPLIR